MKELLEVLERLYMDQDNIYQEEGWTSFNESELYNEAVALCNEYLITSGGSCNWDNIHVLRNNGYRVFAGEKDNFGWLTGCVQKHNDLRVLVYG
jgi:shikimate kinase